LKFTIFGGDGFIGRSLGAYLRSRGHEVYTPERNCIDFQDNFLGHVIYAIGMTGNFHGMPFDTVDAHVCALKKRLQYATYESWLYLSSTRIYGVNAQSTSEADEILVSPGRDGIYNISKLLGESLCLAIENPKVRVARLSNVYGVGQSQYTFLAAVISQAMLNQRVEIQESPESCKDYIYIADVVNLIEKIVIEGKWRIYNVASGINTTHMDLANEIAKLTGTSVTYTVGGFQRKISPIDTKLIKSEFNYNPRLILNDIKQLVLSWKIK
jgi:nucleoside-diphosphate-sugar epimerase